MSAAPRDAAPTRPTQPEPRELYGPVQTGARTQRQMTPMGHSTMARLNRRPIEPTEALPTRMTAWHEPLARLSVGAAAPTTAMATPAKNARYKLVPEGLFASDTVGVRL